MPLTTNAINSSYLGAASDGATRVPAKTLNQDDFLKLLVTQMSSQDPMNPKSDIDMAAQMAQFTSLEQTRGMASNLGSLISQQQILQANSMLGRTVEISTGSISKISGLVSAVTMESGVPKIVVNGTSYDLSRVLRISAPTGVDPTAPLVLNPAIP